MGKISFQLLFRVLLGCIFLSVLWHCTIRIRSFFQPIASYNLALPNFSGNLVKVGTYNIAHGRGEKFGAKNGEGGTTEEKRERLQTIGRLLRDNNLDVVVLNEVDRSSFWSGNEDQSRIIAEASGLNSVVFQENISAGLPFLNVQFGNALVTRMPVKEVRKISCTPHSVLEQIAVGNHDALWVTLELAPQRTLNVIGVHLEVRSEESRVRCAHQILQLIDNQKDPTLIMGDFNSTPRSRAPFFQRTTSGENAVEVFSLSNRFIIPSVTTANPPQYTFPSERPDRTIDWIIAPKTWRLIDYKVVSAQLSDHLLSTAEFEY